MVRLHPMLLLMTFLLSMLGASFHQSGSSPTGVSIWSGILTRQKPSASRLEERYLTLAQMQARQEWERERGIVFPRLVRGNPEDRIVALTFDDGPHPLWTPKLLAILRREKVPATFFVVGKMVDRYPDLIRQEAAEGHEVANHTYDHVSLPSLPPDRITWELRAGAQAIYRTLGSPTRLFRPPGGEYDENVIEATKRMGYAMVLWTDDPGDFAHPAPGILEQRTLRAARNGGILLLHDGVEQTLRVLPDLIRRLKSEGYRFVTISEMARERGVITTGGPRVPVPRMPKNILKKKSI